LGKRGKYQTLPGVYNAWQTQLSKKFILKGKKVSHVNLDAKLLTAWKNLKQLPMGSICPL
jgi:hypothetical protein